MRPTIQSFDATKTKLLTGINLIEASAGTGKTYAIAMLVLRFVVEQAIDIKQILVVTFTKAATEELKDRIRHRLATARRLIIEPTTKVDVSLQVWFEQLSIEPEQVKQRIDQALLEIDQAGIFTIHGFCQRILSEHALESGQLFNLELTTDLNQIKQACTDDFWRQTIYQRSTWEVALLTEEFKTPDQLLASIEPLDLSTKVVPSVQDLDQLFSDLEQLLKQHSNEIEDSLRKLKACFSEGKFKPSFIKTFNDYELWILDWIQQQRLDCPQLSHLTTQGLISGLSGHQFRNSKTKPPSEQQKQQYLTQLQINDAIFSRIDDKVQCIKRGFRGALLMALRDKTEAYLQQHNVLSFDSLITRLESALTNDLASILVPKISRCYRAALIDEFQDTDSHQWFIFSALFARSSHFLYLIGDPKQAIYKFRGADIHAYFNAQTQAQHYFTLTNNWRSTPSLVAAINQLFNRNQPFYFDQPSFYPVQPALSLEDGYLARQKKAVAPLRLSQLEAPEKGYWSAGKAREAIQQAVIGEIIDLLTTDFSLIQSGCEQPVQPQSIAILVRTNEQAKSFQQALNQLGITAVINQKVSVFSSQEATDLLIVLQTIIQPGIITQLRQALALDWFGLDGQQLVQLDEQAMDYWVNNFQRYNALWQTQGLMTMMRVLLNDNKVATHLAQSAFAERRITNLHHCIELLQQAINDEQLGIHKALDWLHHQITQTEAQSIAPDEQQLRLESDDNAIKILTMHSAKGLEFPIVFCPFLWEEDTQLAKEKQQVKCYDQDQLIIDLGSEQFEQHHQQAMDEGLAEALRVFYVAVTRAKYRCYLSWVDVRTKSKPNRSSMGYLFDFAEQDFSTQQQKLTDLSRHYPNQFEYRLITRNQSITGNYAAQSKQSLHHCRSFSRSLDSHWQMSSYSALSLLSIHEAPELPVDKAEENELQSSDLMADNLPRGAHTGNVIHTLLETISFQVLADQADISVQRDKVCLRYGLKTDQPEQLDQLLYQTVMTPLSADSSGFKLVDLKPSQCLKEMPFYLAMKTLDVQVINQILQAEETFQLLSKKQLSGYLTGFIDLVCEYNGRYYVIDYKSNALPSYSEDDLIRAMREHNYGLQYWIYSLVLHLYLSKRLKDYNYQQHFGGVKYLFVRGMSVNTSGGGVFQTKPGLNQLEELVKVFL